MDVLVLYVITVLLFSAAIAIFLGTLTTEEFEKIQVLKQRLGFRAEETVVVEEYVNLLGEKRRLLDEREALERSMAEMAKEYKVQEDGFWRQFGR